MFTCCGWGCFYIDSKGFVAEWKVFGVCLPQSVCRSLLLLFMFSIGKYRYIIRQIENQCLLMLANNANQCVSLIRLMYTRVYKCTVKMSCFDGCFMHFWQNVEHKSL